jgi:hypothetical protein
MSKLIPLLLLPFLLYAQDKPPETCTISGIVVDALTGLPLNKVDLTIEPRQPNIGATTDAKGNFTIQALDPGQYFLAASRNGYLDTFYGERRPGGGKIAIVLDQPGQEVKDITVKLFPIPSPPAWSTTPMASHDTLKLHVQL